MGMAERMALALLFAMGGATTAQAGLRAIYFDASKSKQLIIEVADNGDARIGEADSADYGLLIGGKFLMVGNQEGKIGRAHV